MTLPQQFSNIQPERQAQAPYNFVPLPENIVKAVDNAENLPDQDCYDPNGYTGYFEVGLETRSPLYVRCPLTETQFKNQQSKKYADGTDLPEQGNPEFRRLVKN